MGYSGRKEENERERKSFRVVGPFFSFVRDPLTTLEHGIISG